MRAGLNPHNSLPAFGNTHADKRCRIFGSSERSYSKDKGLWDIRHRMGMVPDTRKYIFRGQQWLLFYVCFIMTVYYKMWQTSSQNTAVILLQNTTKVCHKMRQVFYYQMRQYYKTQQFYYTKCNLSSLPRSFSKNWLEPPWQNQLGNK